MRYEQAIMISLGVEWKKDGRGDKFNPAKRVTKIGGEGEEKRK